MSRIIPPFDPVRVLVEPWTMHGEIYGWIALMGFLIALACGLCGCFLLLRRMALVGDAISHSVLPGIVLAFLWTGTRNPWVMMVGAACSGVLTTVLIEFIQTRSRVKADAATGITFTTLFALGVYWLTRYADKVDLDQDCVLYGEIGFITQHAWVTVAGTALAPQPVFIMAVVAGLVALLAGVFYHGLLVSSFDPGLAASRGLRPRVVHYLLMAVVSMVVVAAFEAVGAVLVIAMLVLPPAFGFLLSQRLPGMMAWSVLHGALSSCLGVSLAVWLDCTVAGAMVVAGSLLFVLAWVFSPGQGLLARLIRRIRNRRDVPVNPTP
jgi:manganese/zinc/iron transport system permease protein